MRTSTYFNHLTIVAILGLMLTGCTADYPASEDATSPYTTTTSAAETPAQPSASEARAFRMPEPLTNAKTRVTKKPFGIKVSPTNSPVQPEKFTGYHSGVDFETTPEEQNRDVPISAICDGKVTQKRSAQGYGGLLVQTCMLDNQPVTVIYGHVKLSSIQQKVGDMLKAGQGFAVLGDAYSSETDNERKHLHLGIRKGTSSSILGYVQSAAELDHWLDATKFL